MTSTVDNEAQAPSEEPMSKKELRAAKKAEKQAAKKAARDVKSRDTGFWNKNAKVKAKKGETCPNCGGPSFAGWCPSCGGEGPATCPSCGSEIHGRFCSTCGTDIQAYVAAAVATPKKRAKQAKKEIERVVGSKAVSTTNELSGIEFLYPDGMAKNADGTFSVTMEFGDVSYEHERKDVCDDIYDKFALLHSSYQPPMRYQINLVNFPVPTRDTHRYLEEVGQTADVARAYNETIEERQRKGRTLFERRNFITLSMPAEDPDIAANRLATAMESTTAHLQAIKCSSHPLGALERAHVLHDLLRGAHEPCYLDLQRLKRGERVRDYIAPSYAVYEESEAKLRRAIRMPGRIVKSFVIRDFGSDLSDRAIRNIRALPIPMCISLYFEPQPHPAMMERINLNIDVVQGQMFNLQSKIVKQGGDPTILPPAVEDREADARDLRNFMRDEDQDIAWFQGIITIFAEDAERMTKYTDMLADQASIWSFDMWNIPQFQEDCLTGMLPLASAKLDVFRSLCTAERAAMIPFSSINITNDPARSYYMGVEKVTRADIFIDPDGLMSPHMWVFGPTGSGKSMQLKFMLDYHLLHNPRVMFDSATGKWSVANKKAPQWWIYDFHAEYGDIAERHGGSSSQFGPGHQSCLNPLDISTAEGELTFKDVNANIDFFIALIEAILGRPMTSREKSELDECLIKTYEPYIGTDKRPTLVDLQHSLKEGGNAVAGEIADSIKMYVTGTMSSFAYQTNVKADPWLNRFDMSELGSTMQTIGMLATLQHVRMAAYQNNREGRATYLLIEEIQKLFANDAAVSVFVSFFAEMRKYGLHIICVTQLPKAVLEHPMVSDLFDNSSLFVFLPQQEQEAALITDLFKLSDTQAGYISATAEKGTGLIIADGIKVGFDNRIPDSSLLYHIHNTDPGKAAREKAKREEERLAAGEQQDGTQADAGGKGPVDEESSAEPEKPLVKAGYEGGVVREPAVPEKPVVDAGYEGEGKSAYREQEPRVNEGPRVDGGPSAAQNGGNADERGAVMLNRVPMSKEKLVTEYLEEHPQANAHEVASALGISWRTANKWISRAQRPDKE